jgi:hypothetical protein
MLIKIIEKYGRNQCKNHYTIEIFWSGEDEGFIAFSPELPGYSAWGATRGMKSKLPLNSGSRQHR